MASILLLGAASELAPLVHAIPSGHTLYLAPDASDADDLGAPALLLPEGAAVDAVFDVAVTRAERTLPQAARRPGVPFFCSTLTTTATQIAASNQDATVIGISYLPTLFALSPLVEAAPALQVADDARAAALALLIELTGKQVEVVADRVALVSVRTLVMIINEAGYALMEGVAGADDIDTAMKLGTNYPEGPLRWGNAIGLDNVVSILEALYDEYREERYRPCVLLKQLARAGRPVPVAAA